MFPSGSAPVTGVGAGSGEHSALAVQTQTCSPGDRGMYPTESSAPGPSGCAGHCPGEGRAG